MKLELLLIGVLVLSGCVQSSGNQNSPDSVGVPSGNVGLGVSTDLPDLSAGAGVNVSGSTPKVSSESLGDAI